MKEDADGCFFFLFCSVLLVEATVQLMCAGGDDISDLGTSGFYFLVLVCILSHLWLNN